MVALVQSCREAEESASKWEDKWKGQGEELIKLREEARKQSKGAAAVSEVEALQKEKAQLQKLLESARHDALLARQEVQHYKDVSSLPLSPPPPSASGRHITLAEMEETEKMRQRVQELEQMLVSKMQSEDSRELQRRVKQSEEALALQRDGRERTKDEVVVLAAGMFDLGQRHLQALTQRYVEAEPNACYSNVPLQSRRRQLEKSFLPLSKKVI